MIIKYLFITLSSLLLIASCGKNQTDLENFINQTKLNGSAKVKELPKYVAYKKFVYESDGIRDPFVPEQDAPVVIQQEEASKDEFAPNTNRKKEPLEQFPLDTLEMVGTLQQKYKWALIRTTEGDIYRVKVGNYLGKNYGEIVELNDTKIIIKEVIKDGLGDWVERLATISMGE